MNDDLIARDPVLHELREREDVVRALYAQYIEALMRRDGMVHALLYGADSPDHRGPTEIARAIRVDRTWPYRIARQWPSRLADWRREHPEWTWK